MSQTVKYDLQALKAVTDEACKAAFEKRAEIGGAVNWARLRCGEALRCEDQDGDVRYEVRVYKASSGATELQSFINTYLQSKGFSVSVLTEW